MSAEPLTPDSIARLISGYEPHVVNSGMSGANVIRLEKPRAETLFLKWADGGPLGDELRAEAQRLGWLGARLPVPRLHAFDEASKRVFLLISALPGRDALYWMTHEDPAPIVRVLAESLRRFHAVPSSSCPFDERLGVLIPRLRSCIDAGFITTHLLDNGRQGRTIEDLWSELLRTRPSTEDVVLTHRDFTLDNVVLDGTKLTGFIDVGRCGLADRYRDLAVIARDLGPEWEDDFFAAYGIPQAGREKLAFYRLLDEFF